MPAWTVTSARTALRDRSGLNATQCSDARADAALAVALQKVSDLIPNVTNLTLTNQTSRRITGASATLAAARSILQVEVPIDEEPRTLVRFQQEEPGVVWLPGYEPGTETVRVWYVDNWTVTSLPVGLQEETLTAAMAFGLRAVNVALIATKASASDAQFAYAMSVMISDARAEWESREPTLAARGAALLARWGEPTGGLWKRSEEGIRWPTYRVMY